MKTYEDFRRCDFDEHERWFFKNIGGIIGIYNRKIYNRSFWKDNCEAYGLVFYTTSDRHISIFQSFREKALSELQKKYIIKHIHNEGWFHQRMVITVIPKKRSKD